MRNTWVCFLLLACWLCATPSHGEDAESESLETPEQMVRRLMHEAVKLLDRLDALERKVDEIERSRPTVAPAPASRETPPSGSGDPSSAAGASPAGRVEQGRGPRAHKAVVDALRWLAAHQSPDGRWEAAGFHRWCDGRRAERGPDGLGKALYDPGVTGLAICAFLGAGHSPLELDPFGRATASGLQHLMDVQDAEGCFGPRTCHHYIYNHAAAALAMVRAYGVTRNDAYRASAQKALDFITLARNPYYAWRYGVKPGDNDTSVTGWMMMVLKSAKRVNDDAESRGGSAPLSIDDDAFDGIRAWIDKMTDPDYGRTGYDKRGEAPARPQALMARFPGSKSESMTSVGMLARIFVGEDPRRSEIIKKGAELCARVPPVWNPTDGSIDMYYWYYGTLAMFEVGGPYWKKWNEHLKVALLDHQRTDTTYCLYKGSWDPIGPWGPDGGRVYSTALMAMCLEVYFRWHR